MGRIGGQRVLFVYSKSQLVPQVAYLLVEVLNFVAHLNGFAQQIFILSQ